MAKSLGLLADIQLMWTGSLCSKLILRNKCPGTQVITDIGRMGNRFVKGGPEIDQTHELSIQLRTPLPLGIIQTPILNALAFVGNFLAHPQLKCCNQLWGS